MKIPIICGPTASGKTDLALKLSESFDIEVINADSRQIYKYFDIGTNKGKISHTSDSINVDNITIPKVIVDNKLTGWLFDFLDPQFEFTLNDFNTLSSVLIQKIIENGKIPVLVGGTGLYIDSLVKGYNLNTKPDRKLREIIENLELNELQKLLEESGFDLGTLNNSDQNNKRRLIRLLEKSEVTEKSANVTPKYEYILFYPEFEREKLYAKIDHRVDEMISEGFILEVRNLIDKGFSDVKAMSGIGYKEVIEYLDKKINLDEMISSIKTSHRNYAKRQITWFEGDGRNYKLLKVNGGNVINHFGNFFPKNLLK